MGCQCRALLIYRLLTTGPYVCRLPVAAVWQCEVKRAPEAKAAAPATTNRSMSRAKRRTSLTNHAVDDCPRKSSINLPTQADQQGTVPPIHQSSCQPHREANR